MANVLRERATAVVIKNGKVLGHEIDSFPWWDNDGKLPTLPHVEAILKRL